ncbi:MAG: flagellar hook-length control protein FliK [Thiobacillus sp.]
MNTLPIAPQPASAPDATGAKPLDAGSAGTPFGQVLSNELANQRSARAAREDTDAGHSPSPASGAEATNAPAGTDAAAQVQSEAATPDADGVPLETVTADAATLLALAATPTALPPVAPTAVGVDGTSAEGESTDAADGLAAMLDPGARKGRIGGSAPLPDARATAAAPGREAADAANVAPLTVPGKGSPQVAPTAAQASQAPGVSAPDTQPADTRFEQILHPALRAAAQAVETPAEALRSLESGPPRLAPAVGSAAWGQALADRIVWMAGAAQQTATLTLNPPNLGPLQIVLNVSNDQAVANFFAAQPEVRHAIESAMPRLKDMMQDAGIQLQQATVSADTSPRQQDQAPGRSTQAHTTRFGAAEAAEPVAATASVPLRAGRGLVDTFA